MKKILCLVRIHSFRKFFTENKFDNIVYLECRWCGKRTFRGSYTLGYAPLDEKWLEGKTLEPKFPYSKRPPEK